MALEDSTEVGTNTGNSSSLSEWAGPYVTDMMGQAQALGNEDYQSYGGPLTAGTSELQDTAMQGIGSLNTPTDDMGITGFQPESYTGANVNQYMNPYLMNSLQPQIDEARRQSEIDRISNAGRMTQAGSFGGSRQAVLDAENQYGLQRNLSNIVGKGYDTAFTNAQNQFNTEQDRGMTAQNNINQYGLNNIDAQMGIGAIQRDIEAEGITADRDQFEEERDYPFKQVQFMNSILQGLPIDAMSYQYAQPNDLNKMITGGSDFEEFFSSFIDDGINTPLTDEQAATNREDSL